MNVTKAQYRAMTHQKGPCLVLAGPGSGKTFTIVKRIEYLIRECSVKPEEILVVTFTRAAAEEMQQRFYANMNDPKLPVAFGTFHSIFYGILKWAYHLDGSCFFSSKEQWRLMEQIVRNRIPDFHDELIRELFLEISRIKNQGLDATAYHSTGSIAPETFQEIYTSYEKEKDTLGKMDFDDMLIRCLKLFREQPDILKKWQERFTYILIDEFQDINMVQYEVIALLAEKHRNLFVVGDDDQSIYSFRGAQPGLMLNFERDYPDAQTILLDVNFRSPAAIVACSGRVIARNEHRLLKVVRPFQSDKVVVKIRGCKTPVTESLYVMNQIKDLMNQGISGHHIAVIYRSKSDAAAVIDTFMEYEIPYYMKEEKVNLYDHFIGRDLISYIKLASGSQRREDFLRIANHPNRYITRESLDREEISFLDLRTFFSEKEWMWDYIDEFEADIRFLKNASPYAAIQYIRRKIGYDDFVREYADSHHISKETLFEMIHEIEERAKAYRTKEEWLDYIHKYQTLFCERKDQKAEKNDRVHLMTMHGAKGLEYDEVFIIGANEGAVPHKKAALPEEIEEERRLFYVALTRSGKHLHISYVNQKNGKDVTPSRFMAELSR